MPGSQVFVEEKESKAVEQQKKGVHAEKVQHATSSKGLGILKRNEYDDLQKRKRLL